MRREIGRAWKDTKHQVGGTGGIILLIVGLVGGIAIRGLTHGQDAILAEVGSVVYGAAAYATLLVLMFAYNLCAAPFRIERDRTHDLEGELRDEQAQVQALSRQLDELLDDRPRLTMSIEQALLGGSADNMKGGLVAAIMRVVNSGGSPIALEHWDMFVESPAGDKTPCPLKHLGGLTTLSAITGDTIRFREEDTIYKRTATPVPPGGIVGGPIFSLMPPSFFEENLRGYSLVIRARDVSGREVEARHLLKGDTEESDRFRYIPYVNAEYVYDTDAH